MESQGTMGMARDTTLAQRLAFIFGVAFLGAGILGFVPGITANYGELEFWSADSDAELLGLFQVSIFHNLFHAAFGIAGLAMARSWEHARTYLLGSGVIYLALIVYGILFGGDNGRANFVPVNDLDTYLLHPVLAAGLLASWYASRDERMRPAT